MKPGEVPPNALDYPAGRRGRARQIAEELSTIGVEEVCLEGPAWVPGGHRVLGKGHAAIVLRASLRRVGNVAVKVRRADSKRDSLALECAALKTAWPVTPRVHWCTDEFILMDLVEGEPVTELARSVRGCEEALTLIAKVAEAARWLDRVGVCHEELSDLRGHAFIVGNAVKFIDFESASMRYCCTVCKVMSWALHRSPLPNACPKLKGVAGQVREALKNYKRRPNREEFLKVIEALAEVLRR